MLTSILEESREKQNKPLVVRTFWMKKEKKGLVLPQYGLLSKNDCYK